MQVKCFKCKEKSEKVTMKCVEKGKEKITRRYFHEGCYMEFLHEQEIKEKDLKELDDLYKYLLKLHSLELLDGRMMEKIQDLRNGSIKVKNKKIKKYKQGIPYSLMLDTYKYLGEQIDKILLKKQSEPKWNQFSYVFSTMVNTINTIKDLENYTQEARKKPKINAETIDIQINKNNKKDELDISDFL